MTDEQAFLRAICENPEDDAPRLIFADWLEEHGDTTACKRCEGKGYWHPNPIHSRGCPDCKGAGHLPDNRLARAEFIRIQCDLANLEAALATPYPDQDLCSGVSANWCPICGDCCCPCPEDRRDYAGCPLHNPRSRHAGDDSLWAVADALRRRERELRLAMLFNPKGQAFTGPLSWSWVYRRGFVEAVTCSAADWIQHGPAVVACQPVLEVRLSDRNPAVIAKDLFVWWAGEEGEADQPFRLPWELWRRLPGPLFHPNAGRGAGRSYRTPQEASSGLSAACLSWARAEIGLPPIRSEAARLPRLRGIAR